MIKPPRLRTGEHEESYRHATWLELFYDLVFVVVVSRLAELFIHEFTFAGFLKFTFLFFPIWWAWAGHTLLSTRFDTDDAFHRWITFLQMLGALFLAVSVKGAFGDSANRFALSFVFMRVVLMMAYVRVFVFLEHVRHGISIVLSGFGIGTGFWVISLWADPPLKYILWAAGLFIDCICPLIATKRLHKIPVHSLHLPERLGLFMIIVLGESILAVTNGIADIHWNLESVIIGVLGFGVAVSLWYIYFEYLEQYISGSSLGAGQLHIYGHFPVYLGIVTFAAGMSLLISNPVQEQLISIYSAICGGLFLFFSPITFFQFIRIPREKFWKWFAPEAVLFIGTSILLACGAKHLPRLTFSIIGAVMFFAFVCHRYLTFKEKG